MKENKIAGIYKITNNITGDFYVGSSKNIEKRWSDHKSLSVWKRRSGMKLYQAFIKYGLDNFTFEILEKTDNLHEREQYYIEQLKPVYNDRYAEGQNTERYRAYYQAHRDEYLARSKDWHKANQDEHLAKMKAHNNRLCLYNGKTLTLNALALRFRQRGIANPYKEAKKYLL